MPAATVWRVGRCLTHSRQVQQIADPLAGRPAADRDALVQLIRAKGSRQELDYLRRFNEHGRLRKAVVKLAQS